MSPELKQFIKDHNDLINENVKESWEEIYNKIPYEIVGQFTQKILSAGINDPAELLGYIPKNYLRKSNIETYKIPNNVTSIGERAFSDCSSLKNIEITDSVTSIGYGAFDGCSGLKGVYITDIEKWCNISFSNSQANPLYYAKNLYVNNELLTELIISDSVTSIGMYAFSSCSNLTSVVIPDNVTSIGYEAFYQCTSLTSVVIGDGVKSIDSYAFEHCSKLTTVVIGNNVMSIGDLAFDNCVSLKAITYTGTEKDALTRLKVRNKRWRDGSPIKKIICTDGEIIL